MGISGIFKEIGPGSRESLLSLSAAHATTHHRPLRLAIDTSIWLFQIQAAQGGSNPALRTFYYRLLRLLAHNIHPLFVFDGPNKPTFKRNKKVGGPGVRVASVPEFLAKQLLKQFGFPWHVAPGEAEAECAVLQREGVVDVVMSEDVDTLMFGSGVTVRNWSAQGKGKVPTHVDVYRAAETLEKSGLDREGMILVALMSGGDYLVEGIPGCGPKVACDAARAGFGKELCAVARRRDVDGLREWRERLQREIQTNESKFFTRRSKLVIPEDFPSREVLGYYTHPCVSPPDKIEKLRESLRWDQEIDFLALRAFTADAFDWRCISGAKKFIRNLAPAMLVRQLRLRNPPPAQEGESSTYQQHIALEEQEHQEKLLISTIHSKRTHASTDNSLEYRISFTPMSLVPIDLSLEDEDEPGLPAGGGDDLLSEADGDEWAAMPSSTAADNDEEGDEPAPKTRGPSLYDPTQPEKMWLLADFLKQGCPLLVSLYENGGGDARKFFKARREARAKSTTNIHAAKKAGKGKKKAAGDMPENALMAYTRTVKASQVEEGRRAMKELSPRTAGLKANARKKGEVEKEKAAPAAGFRRLESTQSWMPPSQPITTASSFGREGEEEDDDDDPTPKPIRMSKNAAAPKAAKKSTAQEERPFAKFTTTKASSAKSNPKSKPKQKSTEKDTVFLPSTPARRSLKRPSPSPLSSARSQRTIDSYYSPTPKKPLPPPPPPQVEIVSLLSSSPVKPPPLFDGMFAGEGGFLRNEEVEEEVRELLDSVTKRRPKGRGLKRAKTAPPVGLGGDEEEEGDGEELGMLDFFAGRREVGVVEGMDLAFGSPEPGSPSPVRSRRAVDVAPMPKFVAPPLSPPTTTMRASTATTAGRRRSPRASSSSSSSIIASSKPKHTSSKDQGERSKLPPKKQRIQLRESLPGSFKIVDAPEMLDLTGDFAGGRRVHGDGKVRSWRESGVCVLDLTED